MTYEKSCFTCITLYVYVIQFIFAGKTGADKVGMENIGRLCATDFKISEWTYY